MSNKNYNNNPYGNGEFSRVYRIATLCAGIDDSINLNKYNFRKMISYECKGYDLIGSSCNTADPRRHFLVSNNRYKVYEVPMKSNTGLRMTGKFLVIIKNLDMGFWSISFMTHKFVVTNNVVREAVTYTCEGEFEVTESYNNMSINCICGTGYCCRGFRSVIFDSDDIRKKYGYHTTRTVIDKTFGIKRV